MKTFVALLRGINVGGHNRLPMKDFATILAGLGADGVRTYIQSGNAVFQSGKGRTRLSGELASAIQEQHGFKPHVLVLELDDIIQAIANNPFPEGEAQPDRLHLGFLSSEPETPDLARLENIRAQSERFRLVGTVFYLYAPDGVARSRLAAGAEKAMGVPMTDRNWTTVCKMLEMARG